MLDLQTRFASLAASEIKPKAKKLPPIYTADLETDPFAYNQMIAPFAAGFYDGQDFELSWGKDCIAKFFAMLETKPAGIIYIHNLGGFDFFWMLPYFTGETLIRNSRIVSTHCKARDGQLHEIRDSYAIMPFALKEYKGKDGKKVKLDIDIEKLNKANRANHKPEIVAYLRMDCVGLHELVTKFIERFGDKLTIGSTAMQELQKLHDFIRIDNAEEDHEIRSQFYYGGRVQCFQSGVLKGKWKVYDVNSMYPYVMKTYRHPIGKVDRIGTKIGKETAFILTEGHNYNAFPFRDKDGNLRFDVDYGTFGVTIHEWNVALKYGLFKPKRVISTYNFKAWGTFAAFVDKFAREKIEGKRENDSTKYLFAKTISNSGYGKFAQDSSQYMEYQITDDKTNLLPRDPCDACRMDHCSEHWNVDTIYTEFHLILWKKANPKPVFYNVATGCSITGASRSVLLEAYANADNPVYCDTDSLICERLNNVPFSDVDLGAWKEEGSGDILAIAGKKLYALFAKGKSIKQANKGCRISAKEIRYLAGSDEREIIYQRESPSLSIDGDYRFLQRRIRKTV